MCINVFGRARGNLFWLAHCQAVHMHDMLLAGNQVKMILFYSIKHNLWVGTHQNCHFKCMYTYLSTPNDISLDQKIKLFYATIILQF